MVLDNESEEIVQDALNREKLGLTTLIIAHRLSTIRNSDLIVGIEDGVAKEIGTHDDRIEFKGIYYQLFTSQQLKDDNFQIINNSEEQSFTDFKLEKIKSSSNTKLNLQAV